VVAIDLVNQMHTQSLECCLNFDNLVVLESNGLTAAISLSYKVSCLGMELLKYLLIASQNQCIKRYSRALKWMP
jgi:hypothetical protein